MFFQELKKFSKENYWIYIILFIASLIVFFTGKGNVFEIIILFFINLIANIFLMVAIGSYNQKKNKSGAIFHFITVITFTFLAIYSFFYKGQSQYIIWQICFIISAIKASSFYLLDKNIKFFNPYFLVFLNILFLGIFISFGGKDLKIFGYNFQFNNSLPAILTALGFSFNSTGLVSINDNFRYFLNYIGSILVILGACIGTYFSYSNGNLNGVDLGYFLLGLTSFLYYSKLLPGYFRKVFKKNLK